MKLYLTQAGRWSGTQADARKDGSFEQVEVPTDKPGLLDWLNTQQQGGYPGVKVIDAALRDEGSPVQGEGSAETYAKANEMLDLHAAKCAEAKPTVAKTRGPKSADDVMEWVLDEASAGEIENLFSALGARFHEMRRAAK